MFRQIIAILVCTLVAEVAIADTLRVPPIPTCPHPRGHIGNLPPGQQPLPAMDKDGDGKSDRRYFRHVDPNGNDFEIWCLDHGPTGDYAFYASEPGKQDRVIHRCIYIAGRNHLTVETDARGNLKRFRGVNYDPRLPPAGTGGDREYFFDWETSKYRVVKTKDKYPKTVRTARYDADPLSDYAVAMGPIDEFIASVADPGEVPIEVGRGSLTLMSVDEFERSIGHYLLDVDLVIDNETRPLEVIYHPVGTNVADAAFNQANNALEFRFLSPGIEDAAAELSVVIPRELLDSRTSAGDDIPYKILFDGQPAQGPILMESEEYPSETDRVIYIKYGISVTNVTILGNEVGNKIDYPVITSIAP